MSQVPLILFCLLTGAAALAVNWMIWFHLLPAMFRQLRDQHRRLRDRRQNSKDR